MEIGGGITRMDTDSMNKTGSKKLLFMFSASPGLRRLLATSWYRSSGLDTAKEHAYSTLLAIKKLYGKFCTVRT
jgi:hypothetical protein